MNATLKDVVLVDACTGAPLLATEPAETSPISIKPLPNGDWQVEYQLDYPVDGLQFMRSAGFLREENW